MILDQPRRTLISIIFSNIVINASVIVLLVFFSYDLSHTGIAGFEIITIIVLVIFIPAIIIFGDILPKAFSARHHLIFSRYSAIPLYWISVFLFPIAEIFSELIRIFIEKVNFRDKDSVISEEDIKHLAEIGREVGAIQDDEHELISGMVSSKKTIVREIIIPRVDMIALPIESDLDEVIGLINKSLHSRIPVYQDDLDNIKGVLFAKDLLPLLKNPEFRTGFKLEKTIRPALFVPSTKKIGDLLREFQEKKTHLAIVVDEYGGTMGLVTLEDVIEEIIGELREDGDDDDSAIVRLNDQSFLCDGLTPFDEIRDELDLKIDEAKIDYDTIGGFVYYSSGEIPKEGYSFIFQGYRFTVKQVINRRIKKVLIERL